MQFGVKCANFKETPGKSLKFLQKEQIGGFRP